MREIGINEIPGFKIGHAQDETAGTGCTVILCEDGAAAGVDVSGSAPATKETDLLSPVNMVERIHGVMLSGGSAYGLDACSGAMQFLEEKGIGFDVGVGTVPIVCGASLFDLIVGSAEVRPDKAMGYSACVNAWEKWNKNETIREGCVGAGTGAAVGKYLGPEYMMKSGLGTFAAVAGQVMCGAIVAVNALGDIFDFQSGMRIAGLLNEGRNGLRSTEAVMYAEIEETRDVFKGNTTIGCILTNAALTKAQAAKVSSMAHDGYARVIRPVHTSADGDAVFTMSSGDVSVSADALGTLAAEVMAKAVNRAVLAAESMYGLKSSKEICAAVTR